MNKQSNLWLLEQQRVDDVVTEIEKKQLQLRKNTGNLKEGIIKLRKNFWEDVTINVDEPDDIIETQASIKQQAELLSEKERSHGHQYDQLKTLDRLHDTPYFGRIDFHEDNGQEAAPIYIGMASLMDENDEAFLVYDWRAPIASMYYDYTLGQAKYITMDGIIEGNISLKRQFIIKSGKIDGLFDTGLTIGDHLLQKMLGNHSSTKMKSIVATIQKEQNRIIRNIKSKFLIVQGVAGSGKTSAVLQRIAYLLYANRETLQADNMLLFSPNPLFNSYVATVLPELGEENMRQTTYMDYAEERLGELFLLEDPFDQMESILTHEDGKELVIRMEAIQYKSSLAFKELIDKHIADLAYQGLLFNDITFQDRTIISAEKIKERFYNLSPSLSIPNRLENVSEWLLEMVAEQERYEQYQDWVTEEIELLDKEDYLDAYHEVQRLHHDEDETFDDMDQEWEILSENVVQEHFQPIKDAISNLEFADIKSNYDQLFKEHKHLQDLPKNWGAICKMTLRRFDSGELAWEDVTAYLYFLDQLRGIKSYTNIRHVFIDEAQDYSPFQFAYLKGLFPHCHMTVLGDVNQAIYAHSLGSPSVLEDPGKETQEKITLMRSYRSTQPIVTFTKQLIEGGEKIEPFNRDGNKPTLTMVEDGDLSKMVLDRIHILKEAGHQTIAIICKTMAESEIAHNHLKSEVHVQLMDQETYSFNKGSLILPTYLAKGIEFDAVIIYNASAYNKESERKLFYTACTRAMHELHMFTDQENSVFIDDASPETYVLNP